MRNMLKIILIGISFLFSAQESYDEIDYLISFDNQYLFLPNRIEKIESLWYMEDSDSLFTGRVEIFLMDDEKTKIAECTIINGIKNGYFKQYYNQEMMLPEIMGLYVNDKREGKWIWVEPVQLGNKNKWFDSSTRLVTGIDYVNGLKNGTIFVYEENHLKNGYSEKYPFSSSDIILQGEYENNNKVGVWFFNDQISSDYDRLNESIYSNQLTHHWTRKETYDNSRMIQNQCREPWERVIDCDDYINKYDNKIYELPNRMIMLNKERFKSNYPMVLIKDADGYDVELNIIKFIEHLDEYHSVSVSTHKQNGHRFVVNEDFRNKIYKLLWD